MADAGTGEVDDRPRSPTAAERLAARDRLAPKAELMAKLDELAREVNPVRWLLLTHGIRAKQGALPAAELVRELLDDFARITGDDSARAGIEDCYARAVDRRDEPAARPREIGVDEVLELASRYRYGEPVGVIALNSSSTGFGTAVAFALLPAVFSVLLLFGHNGDVLALAGGIVLGLMAAGIMALGVYALRKGSPVPKRVHLFRRGVVVAVDGVADAYAWADTGTEVQRYERTTGQGQITRQESLMWVTWRGERLFPVADTAKARLISGLQRFAGSR